MKSAPHSINPHCTTPDPHRTAPVCHNPHQIRTSQNGPAPTRSRRECHTLQSFTRLQSMAQDPTRRTSLKRKSAPVRTTKARKPHRSAPQRPEIRTKFVVSNLHPQSFVCESLSAELHPHFFVRKSSANLRPHNSIQKLTFAELCVQNLGNFVCWPLLPPIITAHLLPTVVARL